MKLIPVFELVENTVGKGEKAAYQHFLHFPSGVLLPLTSAEACEKSSRWLWKEKLC